MMLSENQDNIISDNTANKGEVFNVSGCGCGHICCGCGHKAIKE